MNKAELVRAMAERTGQSIASAERSLNAFTSIVTEQLGKHEEITLVGFGNFTVKNRSEREGRNPKTGEKMKIPAKAVPAFKPGKNLKKSVLE